MNITFVPLVLVLGLVSGAAQAALQGRDLDGSSATAEAYYDTVLNITWLKDTNYGAGSIYDDDWHFGTTTDGLMNWSNAKNWTASLSFYDAINNITYDNWRLPTVSPVNGASFVNTVSVDGSTDAGYNISGPNSEMGYMFYVNLGNRASITKTGLYGGCGVVPDCLVNVGPFTNLKPFTYWSDTSSMLHTALTSTFRNGEQYAFTTDGGYYAWAVSPGDVGVAVVPEPGTYAMLLAGLGLVGWRTLVRGYAVSSKS